MPGIFAFIQNFWMQKCRVLERKNLEGDVEMRLLVVKVPESGRPLKSRKEPGTMSSAKATDAEKSRYPLLGRENRHPIIIERLFYIVKVSTHTLLKNREVW